MKRSIAMLLVFVLLTAMFPAVSAATILGIKALCLLFPAACALGSWLVFRFLWNLTPELRQKIAAAKTANS